MRRPPISTLFPYPTLFRSFDLSRSDRRPEGWTSADAAGLAIFPGLIRYDETYGTAEITHAFRVTARSTNGYYWPASDRKSTRLNSSHSQISYAVFCLKKKT